MEVLLISNRALENQYLNLNFVNCRNVSNKIKSLKCGKSVGYDGIQDTFHKMGGENLAKSLCLLFNKCIDTCIFPTIMKIYRNLPSL